jgi:ADP-heptose:LPS heptosyltransferase
MRFADPEKRRVRILDLHGQPRATHPLWEGNPHLARADERGQFLAVVNGPNARPYTSGKTPMQWFWKPFVCTPATMVFSAGELAFAHDKNPGVVIEPNVKPKASPNKNWGWKRWVAFAVLATAKGVRLTQLGPPGTQLLPGAKLIETTDFRRACAVLSRARAFVGHEGGMHHAAAAVAIPAVVLFGGFISPQQTGYQSHTNLFTGGTPCGMRVHCAHCDDAMAAITPEQVLRELEAIL